jgi:SAM-dependent methyltransferase
MLSTQKKKSLFDIASSLNTTKITEPLCSHYTKVYEKYFTDIREDTLNIVEIGIKDGDSLLLWERYFPNATIYGADINPDSVNAHNNWADHERINTFLLDQGNITDHRNFISTIAEPIDIVIDDGGHKMAHQILSFKELFPVLKPGGLFIVEDLCTSYWGNILPNSGVKNPTSAVSFFKDLVDNVNYSLHRGCHGRPEPWENLPPVEDDIFASYLDRHTESVCFYQGLCIIQKK